MYKNVSILDFIAAKDDGDGGDIRSYNCTKLQLSCHHKRTSIQLYTGRMPFLSPNKQWQSTEGKMLQLIREYKISPPGQR